jgi:hypothetical protein
MRLKPSHWARERIVAQIWDVIVLDALGASVAVGRSCLREAVVISPKSWMSASRRKGSAEVLLLPDARVVTMNCAERQREGRRRIAWKDSHANQKARYCRIAAVEHLRGSDTACPNSNNLDMLIA